MAPEQAREVIERLVTLNPRITVAELAKRTRVSRQRIYQLLDKLGYTLEPGRWRKKKKGE
jgi:predicted transcriptional regulator